MWFATDNGVARFNGRKFETFDLDDGLTDLLVFKIFEHPNGDLWFTTSNFQLFYYSLSLEAFIPFEHNDKINLQASTRFISTLLFDKGAVGLATYDGLYKVTADTCVRQSREAPTGHGSIILTRFLKKDVLYYVPHFQPMDQTGSVHDGMHFRLMDTMQLEIHGTPRLVTKPRKGTILQFQNLQHQSDTYVSIDDTLMRMSSNNSNGMLLPGSIRSLAMWNGTLWVGTAHGLYELDPISLSIKEKYFEGISFTGLCVDDEESLWASSSSDGVFYLSKTWFTTHELSVQEADIRESAYSDGKIYLVLSDGSLVEFNCAERKAYPILPQVKNRPGLVPKIWVVEDTIGLSTWDTVYSKTDFGGKKYPMRVKHHVALFGNWSVIGGLGGVKLLDRSTYDIFQAQADKKMTLSFLFRLDTNQFLASSSSDLYYADVEDPTAVRMSRLGPLSVQGAALVGDTALLVTKSKGVWAVHNGDLWELDSALRGRRYSGCAISGRTLYMSSASGITRYHLDSGSVEQFGTYHGLSTSFVKSVYVDDSGNVWAITPRNIEQFDVAYVEVPIRPKVFLNEFLVDGVISMGGELNHRSKLFEFRVSSICYQCGDDVELEYRLIGLNPEWSRTRETTIRFNGLSYGDYVFEIRSVSPNGRASDVKSFAFSIPVPIWKTWWFLTLMAVSIFLVSVLAGVLRNRRLRRNHALKLSVLEQQQLALALQMNPHFIFNSLSSIQSVILEEKPLEAARYVAKFSRLIRDYLEASVQESISFRTEMGMLEKYVELEQIRSGRQITFTCDIDPDFENAHLGIPVFFIQPLLENAIWHGIMPGELNGEIELSLSKKGGLCMVEVKDNGVGLGRKSKRLHASRSTGILEKRLGLLRPNYKNSKEIVREELRGEDGGVLGTRVTMELPIMVIRNVENRLREGGDEYN